MVASWLDLLQQYYTLGFSHVLPLGFDHILFILSLFFLNSNLKSVVIQCSIFTLAHSISLGLTAAGYLMPSSQVIEPLIALSIVYTSIENIIHSQINTWRLLIIFIFGLIHGMGFAAALNEVGLPDNHFLMCLLSFNIGVESGQIVVLFLAYIMVGIWFRNKDWYNERIVYPVSSLIACIALYWTFTRLLGTN